CRLRVEWLRSKPPCSKPAETRPSSSARARDALYIIGVWESEETVRVQYRSGAGNLARVTSDCAQRYRRVASGSTRRVEAVPEDAWLLPAPCEGWVARDVVRHLVELVPPFLQEGAGVDLPVGPSVDTDPPDEWLAMSNGIQRLLDRPDDASRMFDHPMVGRCRLDDAVMTFILPDVLIHT